MALRNKTVPSVCKEQAAPSCLLRVLGKTHKKQMRHEWFKYEDLFLKETQGPRMPKFCQGMHNENVRKTTRQQPKPEKQPWSAAGEPPGWWEVESKIRKCQEDKNRVKGEMKFSWVSYFNNHKWAQLVRTHFWIVKKVTASYLKGEITKTWNEDV